MKIIKNFLIQDLLESPNWLNPMALVSQAMFLGFWSMVLRLLWEFYQKNKGEEDYYGNIKAWSDLEPFLNFFLSSFLFIEVPN